MAKRGSGAARLFALDHNFPIPIVRALAASVPEAKMVPISEIDPRLPRFKDDWRVLLALHHHSTPWDGMITTDAAMLSLPRELAVIAQTKLTLVVPLKADPLRATGLLLTHLPMICNATDSRFGQIWSLSAVTRSYAKPWKHLATIAKRQGRETKALYLEHRLSGADLSADPLSSERVAEALPTDETDQ